jgi:hypothetical protein
MRAFVHAFFALSALSGGLGAAPCGVRQVCAACPYTSLGAAVAAAAPCEAVELLESRSENLVLNKDLAELRASSPSIVWSGSGGSATLEIKAGMNRDLRIYGFTLAHVNAAGRVLDWSAVGPLSSLELEHMELRQETGMEGLHVRNNLGSPGQLKLHHSKVLGSASAKNALLLQGQSTPGAIAVWNCLFYLWNRAVDCNHNAPSQVLSFLNNTVDSCASEGLRLQCRSDSRNNLFTGNPDDIQLAGGALLSDFSGNAFGAESTAPGNLSGTVRASQYVLAGTDFHLAPGAGARNQGQFLAQVQDDLDGLSRPQEGAQDIGAYEYLPPSGSPTASPSASASPGAGPSSTPSPSATLTPTLSATPFATQSATQTATPTAAAGTATASPSTTLSPSPGMGTLSQPVPLTLRIWDASGALRRVLRSQSSQAVSSFSLSSEPFDPGKGCLLLSDGSWSCAFDGLGDDGLTLPNGSYLMEVVNADGKGSVTRPFTVLNSAEQEPRAYALQGLLRASDKACAIVWFPPMAMEVAVYDLSGAQVWQARAPAGAGRADWALCGASGTPAGPGLYFVSLRRDGQRRPQILKIYLRR